MAERSLRKAGRLKRLWPGRASALPLALRPPRSNDLPEPPPLRGLTASELIAMARQARAVSAEGDPTKPTNVS
ncbi:hypothetical protein CIW48_05430 [Methylobacterium sp. P1-11]|nr:hypothetical protein CIW48_05430 [Methylobacterium sp. P1-11]